MGGRYLKVKAVVSMKPIGVIRTDARNVPRHWSLSDVEGSLVLNEEFARGLDGIEIGGKIVVLFHFHKSPEFTPDLIKQIPPHRDTPQGVFSICSPRRPNPIGLSVLEVREIRGNVVKVRGVDMFDGTPILDIKPHIRAESR
jgi:tRNA-Thr(GGU) m(6)t(6)A37 methyltransferase TsaA